ncbi:MAG: AraC family transcriptional regulator [Burkholderiales bacterium]|nr:AraC family transcriptional regulator [Burkholderiales bacterium]
MKLAAWPVFGRIDFARSRLFETHDVDEARQRAARALLPHDLRVDAAGARTFRARMDVLAMGPLTVCRMAWNAAVEIDVGTLDDDYLLCLPVRGNAECRNGAVRFTAARGSAVLAGGGERFQLQASADYEPIIVRLARKAVDDAWQALSGDEPRRPIRFGPVMPTDGNAWRAIEPVLKILADEADPDAGESRPRHLHARLQDMLATTMLLNQPHSLARQRLPAVGTPAARVRRAEAYMLERLGDTLTLTGIASAVGLPTRTLQWAFQSAHGMGPMQWLRRQRLLAVREALQVHPAPRIADTALAYGFSHLGEFSRHYRQEFRETPSDTVRQRL